MAHGKRLTIPLLNDHDNINTLRSQLATAQRKLRGYADAVVSLHSELRALKENICWACKVKLVPGIALQANQVKATIPPATQYSNRDVATRSAHLRRPVSRALDDIYHGHSPGFNYVLNKPSNLRSPLVISTLPPSFSTIHTHHFPLSAQPLNSLGKHLRSQSDTSSKILSNSNQDVASWVVSYNKQVNKSLDLTLVRTLEQETTVMAVAFSPDGKYLAAALGKWIGKALVYEVETGKNICVLVECSSEREIVNSGIKCLSFSPDCQNLATGHPDSRIRVWEISKKRVRAAFKGHEDQINDLQFSPNGRFLASTSDDQTVCIWNTRDGSSRILSDDAFEFYSVRFSPNGRYFATANFDGKLRIWDLRSGQLVARLAGHDGCAWSVAFTPDGKGLLSGGLDAVVKYWDISALSSAESHSKQSVLIDEEKQESLTFLGHTDSVFSVATSPDGQWVISGSRDHMAHIWSVADAVQQCTLQGHKERIWSVDFSPTGTYLVTGGEDNQVCLWRYVVAS